jgi:hypothetical protein
MRAPLCGIPIFGIKFLKIQILGHLCLVHKPVVYKSGTTKKGAPDGAPLLFRRGVAALDRGMTFACALLRNSRGTLNP